MKSNLKLDLWGRDTSGCLTVSPWMALKWFPRCGAFPGRERTVRPESKDSIFNRIAASEGAAHGSETGLSSTTSSPLCG